MNKREQHLQLLADISRDPAFTKYFTDQALFEFERAKVAAAVRSTFADQGVADRIMSMLYPCAG